MSIEQTLIFVDGENLVYRYQEMLALGHVPRPDNVYIKDCFVWNQRVLDDHLWRVKRLSYYTSVVGDDNKLREVREKISETQFVCTTGKTAESTSIRNGQIVPFVRKKSARSRKESICDIAISVDVMRACYRDHAETIWIFSGDGDFVQLIAEVVHSGKCAYVSAFSSGLNDEIRYVVDEFLPLDKHFFLSSEELAAAKAAAEAANAARAGGDAEGTGKAAE
jgi:uncharacterized LabA/DUF88 family protein